MSAKGVGGVIAHAVSTSLDWALALPWARGTGDDSLGGCRPRVSRIEGRVAVKRQPIDIFACMHEDLVMIFDSRTLRRLSSDRRPSIAPCVACGFAQPELTMDQT